MALGYGTWIDHCLGETRVLDIGVDLRSQRLRIYRWSQMERRAFYGDVFQCRIATIDETRRGAYLDLGLAGEVGFLPINALNHTEVFEGEKRVVRCSREAHEKKGPAFKLLDDSPVSDRPHRMYRGDWPGKDVSLLEAEPNFELRDRIDAALDEALTTRLRLPRGGYITLESTAACLTVDVDMGERRGRGDPESQALQLNRDAVDELARQVELRGEGGLIVVDFVTLRASMSRRQLEDHIQTAFARLGIHFEMTQLTHFGTVEMAVQRRYTPIREVVKAENEVETNSLSALRRLEVYLSQNKGNRYKLQVSQNVGDFLWANPPDWRAILAYRVGDRFEVETNPELEDDQVHVVPLK